MFWKRHFIISLTRRRNSGHGSSGLRRMEGNSSYHFRSCASYIAVSEGERSGDSTRRSWILLAIEQKTELWISGRILSCSMYCGLFGGGMIGTLIVGQPRCSFIHWWEGILPRWQPCQASTL
jgi:hypothetical protein